MTEQDNAEKEYCYYHPDVETGVHCSNCGKPICPREMVFTSVGAKCPDCARPVGRMTAGPKPIYYLRGLGAGLGAAVAGGAALTIIRTVMPFGGFLFGALLGYLVGEAVSRGARRNRGLGLQFIAGFSALVAFTIGGYIIGPVLFGQIIFPPRLISLVIAVIGIAIAVIQLRE